LQEEESPGWTSRSSPFMTPCTYALWSCYVSSVSVKLIFWPHGGSSHCHEVSARPKDCAWQSPPCDVNPQAYPWCWILHGTHPHHRFTSPSHIMPGELQILGCRTDDKWGVNRLILPVPKMETHGSYYLHPSLSLFQGLRHWYLKPSWREVDSKAAPNTKSGWVEQRQPTQIPNPHPWAIVELQYVRPGLSMVLMEGEWISSALSSPCILKGRRDVCL
jgi:hypothetical protein